MDTNPLSVGKNLLERYRDQLAFILESNELSPDAIRQILARMQIDNGIYLSLNPQYEQTNQPFVNFVRQHGLHDDLVLCLPKLAERGLFTHQEQGILSILDNRHTIISTGTGSGKTETFLIPIISHCLRRSTPGVKAIIIYPMNALARDQVERIGAYTRETKVTFGLYTGATPETASVQKLERRFPNQLICRNEIRANPPDILVTNYVMLDRMLTREKDHRIFKESADSMQYLVLDELHTYTGSKAAHLKFLLARLNHYFANDIVYVGTSATLIRGLAGKEKLDLFIRDLLGIDTYTFIEAVEEKRQREAINPPPSLTDADLDLIDFSTEEKAAKSISLLTGEQVNEFEFFTDADDFHNTSVYESLEKNSVVAALQDALHESAQSSDDLVRHISRTIPAEQFSRLSPDKLLEAYLQAIGYVNQKAGNRGKPLMDYRIHIFFKNITGNLKACPECGRYFSGDSSYCPDDGYPLFAVYRHDIRYCVGKFRHQHLSPNVEPESSDPPNVHYVLIARVSDAGEAHFDIAGDLTRDGNFERNPSGRFRLAPLEAQSYEQLEKDLVQVGSERRNYLYLYCLVKTLLQSYGKCLGFIDNREMASRYSAILRDAFASEFLQGFLGIFYPRERQLDLPRTLEFLQKKAASIGASDLEKAIFAEMNLWFHRYIAIPERHGGTRGLLKLRDNSFNWHELPSLHQELLATFIQERALHLSYTDDMADSHFIRFEKYWATGHYGIYIKDTLPSGNPLYRGVTLGERSITYANLVSNRSVDDIQRAADELVDLGILTRQISPDKKTGYYLNAEYLRLDPSPSEYGEGEDGYEQLKRRLLFVADVHSSDRQEADRIRIENGFKRGEIHFVTATPTLEMGIDIGDLESVLMIGAPPSPASYAQRAGRAGRGKKHDALIVTFCWGNNPYDMYAFRNPKQMINGRVSPPVFNPGNPELIKKHVNAFVLRNYLRKRDSLRHFSLKVDTLYEDQLPQLQRLFGSQFPFEQHLGELKEIVQNVLDATDGKSISIAHHCYSSGIFPDYSFRHDQVIAVDIRDKDKLDPERPLDWKDYALTTRDPEQAISFLVPDQTMYVAGEIYKTLDDGFYDLLPDDAKQYTCFFAEKEINFARRRKEINELDIRRYFIPILPDFVDKKGVLAIGDTDQCILSFRNYGVRRSRFRRPSATRSITIGYDLKREALILRFDSLVCSEVLRNSLVAVLIREINETYSLADGEIRLMLNTKLADASNDRWIYALLYDNDGNNNLPLKRIFHDFDTLVQRAYQRLTECECDTDGCYDCIKSYNMQHYDQTLSKDRAEMFTGFLIGKRRFEPSVVPYSPSRRSFDLSLSVRQQRNEIVVTSSTGKVFCQPIDSDLNNVIFLTLTKAIYNEYQASMSSLRIETWVAWLADAINNRSINKGKEAFNRFQHALLHFEYIKAFHKNSEDK